MVLNKKGIIINVASLGAFLPLPMNAVYSVFTESICLELQGTGVKVQALCPGMTRTDFHEKIGFKKILITKKRVDEGNDPGRGNRDIITVFRKRQSPLHSWLA